MFKIFFLFCCRKAEKWRNRRKVLEPAFHLKIIEKSIDVFDRLASTVVDQFVENGPNKSLEIFNIIQRYALDVICGESECN